MKKIISLAAAVLFRAVSMGVQAAEREGCADQGVGHSDQHVSEAVRSVHAEESRQGHFGDRRRQRHGYCRYDQQSSAILPIPRARSRARKSTRPRPNGIDPSRSFMAIDGISVNVNKE
jgi:hypothetical protein